MNDFLKYNKAWIAVAGLLLTVLNQFYGSNSGVQILIATATLAGVHLVPNFGQDVQNVVDDVENVQRG